MNKQFGLSLRIVLKEKKCHIVRLIVHPLVAILLTFFIINVTKSAGSSQSSKSFADNVINQDELADYFPGELVNKIYFTPQNAFIENLMEAVRQQLYIVDERVVPYPSDAEMEFALLANPHICFGVNFSNITDDGRLEYFIRTKNNNFRTSTVYSQDVYSCYRKQNNEYIESGFLTLQNAVDQAYVAMVQAKPKLSNGERILHIAYGHIPVDDKRGPQEPTRNVELIPVLSVVFVVMDIFALLLPMVEERANGMREYLKMASSASYWKEAALFAINFVIFFTILVVCLIIAFFSGYWDNNPAVIVYHIILAFLFLMNLIAFTFFLSTMLVSPTMATAVAPIVFFGPFFLSILRRGLVAPLCLFPVVGLCYAGMIGEVFKSSGHLFLAHNLFTVDYPGTGYVSMFHVYVCQLLGTAVWLFLWFYVSNVYPGQYGIPQEKWFFLSKSYWQWSPAAGGRNRPRNKNKITTESQRNLQQDLSGSNELGTRMEMHDMPYIDEGIEDIGSIDPEQSKRKDPSVPRSQPLVRIFKLYKAFKGRTGTKEVVRDFSLSIYNHSITVLLGHNGAGKTTTMNIITGILPATSGTIEIDGEANPHRYRQKIGFCPQHNVFFSYLNCLEHLEYFGQLRGLNVSDARAEAKTMLEKVNLLDKRKSLVHTLSGGMKRRLSLAIAIMGHTKLLILDEPTSGLDPESRRDIWDVLLRLRENHTILLTTHFMEEADVLGNWVAIMDDGELVAFGTPLFLKQKYGKGYTLKLFKASNFDAKEAWSLIQRYVPNAVVRDSVQEIMAVTLPYDEITQYAAMLKELKDKQRVLGIETFSMANATLEEVFLNSSKQKHEIQHHAESVDSPPSPELFDEPTMSTASTITRRHAMNVVKAIGSKKWIHMKSNKHIFGFLFSLPLLVIICCFIFTTGITDSAKSLPAVWLAAYTIHQPYGILMINRESDSKQPLGNLQTIQSDFDRSPVNGVQMSLVIRENGDSLQDVLREKIVQDYTAYRDQLVVAIECNITNDGTYLTVLYNNNLVHSTGIAESVLTTILLRYYAGTPEAIVRTENIPSTRKQLIDIQTPFYVTELLPIANMFCMLIYLSGPLHEHLTGFRQMHNVNRYLYWGSTYMWDMIVHFVQCVLVVVLLFLLDHKQTFSESSKLSIFWISYVYGLVALPVIYIISQCVQNANTAITIMSYLLITGVAFVFMLSNGYDDIVNNEPWITLLHVVPEFGLKHSMRVVYENQKLTIYEKMSIQQNRAHSALTSFANKRLSLYTFYIMAPAMLVVLVIVLNELVENIYRRDLANEKIRKAYRRLDRGLTISRGGDRARVKRDAEQCDGDQYDETDSPALHVDDVDQQTALVNRLVEDPGEGPSGEYAIIVKALKKTYGDREAVKSVSFAVKKGECFGLLGMNGAGKTTLFEMLSANLPASEGTIYLQRREVRKADEMEYRHQYGYCPQFDALLHFMTVYEVIDYFAQLKGLDMRKTHINSWLTKLDILKYSDHTLEDCSGGTKRKVNTILAMLGGPSVVLLDEPTTGVDPKSRHFLWKTIKAIQRKDQTVLLTSHSMDECEELCNRLSIMVDGRLRCVGTIPELKQRHDKGYNLWIKLKVTLIKPFDETNEDKQLIDEVKERFQATLQEEHKGLLKFLVDVHLELADLFDRILVLESERGHQIENYSINETSLEDIFLLYRPKKRRNT
ncbi:ATP-binding cassette sub-family A member 2 [Anopheles maculipalpis]|uniref:ATP-binding cassette sub-family A member 2 n=1 Tax=Anopheles maculipalpis TaxID=1496333 RepID=UPI0021590F6E|nr:ATP-binding cassette sub-family A member 2 [Anopheles maculipalpis]